MIPGIRLERISRSLIFYENHPDLNEEISKTLVDRLQDPDDKIRVVACSTFNPVTDPNLLESIPLAVFKAIVDRCRDRKPVVRTAAIEALAHLYSVLFGGSHSPEKHKCIPETLIKLYSFEDCEARAHLERIYEELLLSKTPSDTASSLLGFYQQAGDQGKGGFSRYLLHQAKSVEFLLFCCVVLIAGG